jgi:enoyl-CoA hydratase/carnithine racemase
MAFENLTVTNDTGVTRITLNRPEKRNALSLALMREVIAALGTLPAETQVVVLGGEGPAFSAGHDLGELIARDVGFYREVFDVCTQLMETVHRIPQPVIARVHGHAFAAGCQLVASCDLAVSAEAALFATPGVKIGLFCSTPMVPLSRAVGRKRAMEMLLTGEPITAHTALEWGLVNHVVPAEELDNTIDGMIEKITRSSGLVTGIGKQAFYEQVELDEHRAYDLARAVMVSNARLRDAQEGMAAFVEKRAPAWSNA